MRYYITLAGLLVAMINANAQKDQAITQGNSCSLSSTLGGLGGFAPIHVTLSQNNSNQGESSTQIVSENLTLNNPTRKTIFLYPNPTNSVIHIDYDYIGSQNGIQCYVYDLKGKIVIPQFEIADDLLLLDTSFLDAGLYTVVISFGNHSVKSQFFRN